MQTLVLAEPGRLELTDTPQPATDRLPLGHALVRVHRCGVCGTDLHAYRGRQPFFSYPRVLGHELGVEVVTLADDVPADRLAVGDRCAVEPYLNCGHCIACTRGKPNCCVSLQVLGVHTDGGMRAYVTVPAHKLHRSNALTLDQLALVETLGIGAHAVARTRIEADDNVLVIGAGPIGLGAMQFAKATGATVTAMDISEERLAFCREQLGIEHTLKPDDPATAATPATDYTAVLDATGNPQSMAAAFDRPCAGGRLTLVGLFPGEVSFHDPDFHRRELTVRASRNSTPDDFARIIALIESGDVDTTPWITHRAALADVPNTFETWLDPANRCLKAVIDVG